MKVDRSNAKDIIDEFNYIEEQLNFINSFFYWDVPANVERCREMRYKRLTKRLKAITTCEEAEGYNLVYDYFSY
tara:strand:- start:45 stop:266 length:222 start_codon:yes stop_codon:yes gene_type:complete